MAFETTCEGYLSVALDFTFDLVRQGHSTIGEALHDLMKWDGDFT